MKNIFSVFFLILYLSTNAFAEEVIYSIETQGAQDEKYDSNFYSLNLGFHGKGGISHIYGQINIAGFQNILDSNNNAYENLFIGLGAEYNGRFSPYIEAGVDAGLIALFILDAIMDDIFDSNCIEDDNCLSTQYNEDTYLTIGARLFVTPHLTIGAFFEHLSFSNPDTDDNTNFNISGINIRYIFN